MDTHTQTIKVVYEATEAQKNAAKWATDEQKRTKETAEVAKKAAKETADAQGKAAKESAAAAKKAAKEKADAAKAAGKEIKDSDKAINAELDANVRARNNALVRANRARINQQIADAKRLAAEEKKAALDAHAAKEKAAAAAAKQWEGQQQAIMGAVKSLVMYSAAAVGLNSASAIMATIFERFQKLRDASLEGSERMLHQAAAMRSLSSVMGQTGQPSLTQVAMIDMASKTFQTPEDAATMMQAAMEKGYGALDAGLVSKAELQKAAVYQGKRQTLYGESPDAMGNILGMLPMMSEKKGQTGEELEALNQRLDEIRKLAGYKNYAQAVGQVERVSPYVLKGIYTGPMAMALTGAMAMGGKAEEAGTHLEQATTAVTVGLARSRKMKVLPEDAKQYETTAEYFKTLKDSKGQQVNDQMPAHERILAVVNDVIRAEDEAVKAGEHFEGTLYLTKKGFLNQEHMLALTSLTGVQRKGLLSGMIKAGLAPIEAHVPGKGVDADMAKFERDPAGAMIIAERQSALAEQAAFAKDRLRDIQARAAYNRLGGMGYFAEEVKPILSRTKFDPYEAIWGTKHKIEINAQEKILADAKAAGVPFDPFIGVTNESNRRLVSQGKEVPRAFVGWEELFQISQQTGARGGRILPGPDDAQSAGHLEEIAKNTRELIGLLTPKAPGARAPAAAAASPRPLVITQPGNAPRP